MHLISLFFIILCCLPIFRLTKKTISYNPSYPEKCFVRDDLIMVFSERRPHPDVCSILICMQGSVLYTVNCEDQYTQFFHPTELAECKYGDPIDLSTKYPICCIRKLICSRRKSEPEKLSFLTRLLREVEKDYAKLLEIRESEDGKQ